MSARQRLLNRRPAETFQLEVAGLQYTATVGRFPDGRIGDDAAIVCSIAVQFGANIETIRRALCRNSQGRASGRSVLRSTDYRQWSAHHD